MLATSGDRDSAIDIGDPRAAGAEYGFDGHYQRVKVYVRQARKRVAVEKGQTLPLTGLHRRFEVTASGHAQVDWGHEDRSIAPPRWACDRSTRFT